MSDGQDLMRRIAGAGGRIDPGLSDREVERLVAGARRRRQRRARMRRAALAVGAAVSLALTGGLVVFHHGGHAPGPEMAAVPENAPAPHTERILRLSDGSTAVPLDAETQLELLEERPERVTLSLMRGRARFQVTPQPKRAFLVHAGDVRVTVVGTVFTVERVADRVGVAVERGIVRVDWDAGSALVNAGQSGWYPPLIATPHLPRTRRANSVSLASAHEEKGEAAAQLLMAADRARLSGRADEGAELLRKLLREHPNDPRAPLAAFTLGRLLLMELGSPDEAAAAFAQARRVAPSGPFAEDALAREVEALSKAGRQVDARTRAEEYQHLFPNGRRMATVRTAGEIK